MKFVAFKSLTTKLKLQQIKWIIKRATTINGRRNCNAKNGAKVALSRINSREIHWTIYFPKYALTERRQLLTVALHNDVCPVVFIINFTFILIPTLLLIKYST